MTCSVHDNFWFELQGIPSVFIASTEFVDAAETQAGGLGMPDVRRVFVPHPIQDATDEEMRAKADVVVESVLAQLVDSEPGQLGE